MPGKNDDDGSVASDAAIAMDDSAATMPVPAVAETSASAAAKEEEKDREGQGFDGDDDGATMEDVTLENPPTGVGVGGGEGGAKATSAVVVSSTAIGPREHTLSESLHNRLSSLLSVPPNDDSETNDLTYRTKLSSCSLLTSSLLSPSSNCETVDAYVDLLPSTHRMKLDPTKNADLASEGVGKRWQREGHVERGGGMRLPSLEWSATFRKGYAILTWVKPHLCRDEGCCSVATIENEDKEDDEEEGEAAKDGWDDAEEADPHRRAPRRGMLGGRSGKGGTKEDNPDSSRRAGRGKAKPDPPDPRKRRGSGKKGGTGDDDDDDDGHRREPVQLLYRFATNPDNANAVGVCATLGRWTAVPPSSSSSAARGNPDQGQGQGQGPGPTGGKMSTKRGTNGRGTADGVVDASGVTLRTSLAIFDLPTASSAGVAPKSVHPPGRSPGTPVHPSQQPHPHAQTHHSPFITAELSLPADAWSLVSVVHTFPYLKRPAVSVHVNGSEVVRGELGYPVLMGLEGQANYNDGLLDDAVLWTNPFGRGVELVDPEGTDDDAKTASELSGDGKKRVLLPFHLRLATASVYPGDACSHLTPTALALCGEAGPTSAQHAGGMALGPAPPVPANRDAVVFAGGSRNNHSRSDAKGGGNAPDDGRGLGVPTSVGPWNGGGEEVNYQRLLGKATLCYSATDATLSGRGETKRVSCRNSDVPKKMGLADSVPKVGLVQPRPPPSTSSASSSSASDRKSMVTTGRVALFDASLAYAREEAERASSSSSGGNDVDTSVVVRIPRDVPTPSFTLTYASQNPISAILLPFRLALPPPGTTHNLHATLRVDSYAHLTDLLRNNGELAGRLLSLFAATIRSGGNRIREEALQTGSVHVLGCLLRRALVRGRALGVLPPPSFSDDEEQSASFLPPTAEDLKERHLLVRRRRGGGGGGGATTTSDVVEKGLPAESPPSVTSPPVVPSLILSGALDVVEASCGPASPTSRHLPPTLRVRRTSDLALTTLFGFALDFDLWGGDPGALEGMLDGIVGRYGVEYGRLLRGQMAVGRLLDEARVRFRSLEQEEGEDGEGAERDGDGDDDGAGNDGKSRKRSRRQRRRRRRRLLLERAANHLAQIIKSMLLASLSSRSSVSRGERDVSACVAALTDCPLGSASAHVILTALGGVLEWCDAVPSLGVEKRKPPPPPKKRPSLKKTKGGGGTGGAGGGGGSGGRGSGLSSMPRAHSQRILEIHRHQNTEEAKRLKMEVASRLGRNMIMAQFHDVVAPMALGRTVFWGAEASKRSSSFVGGGGGETAAGGDDGKGKGGKPDEDGGGGRRDGTDATGSSAAAAGIDGGGGADEEGGVGRRTEKTEEEEEEDEGGGSSSLHWRHHWRTTLVLFAWLTSIAGPEGEIASKSTGNLLLASGAAGSLRGCLTEGNDDDDDDGGGKGGGRKGGGEAAAAAVGPENGIGARLFLPPPMIAGMHAARGAGGAGGSNYANLLSDRVRVVLPLLPGLVASVVTPGHDDRGGSGGRRKDRAVALTPESANALTDLLATVGVSFQRIYGSAATPPSRSSHARHTKSGYGVGGKHQHGRLAPSAYAKAAKEYAPPLIAVSVLLEEPIEGWRVRVGRSRGGGATSATPAVAEKSSPKGEAEAPAEAAEEEEEQIRQRMDSDQSWIDVPPSADMDLPALKKATFPEGDEEPESILSKLVSCQDVALKTTSDLIVNAMRTGGGEASTLVWNAVVSSLGDYCLRLRGGRDGLSGAVQEEPSVGESKVSEEGDTTEGGGNVAEDDASSPSTPRPNAQGSISNKPPQQSNIPGDPLAHALLCRLAALVLSKIAGHQHLHPSAAANKKEGQKVEVEMWNVELCSAVARLFDLIEERDLLAPAELAAEACSRSAERDSEEDADADADADAAPPEQRGKSHNRDQINLLCSLLDVLLSGREMNGWCQLLLPTPPTPPASRSVSVSDRSDNNETDGGIIETVVGSALSASGRGKLTSFSDVYDLYHQISDMSLYGEDGSSDGALSSSNRSTPSKDHRAGSSRMTPGASSKMLLPILQPCLRIVLCCVGTVRSDVAVPSFVSTSAGAPSSACQTSASPPSIPKDESMLNHIVEELHLTLTAAIVGLSFPNARDVALHALASLRRAILYHRNASDATGTEWCCGLVNVTVGEIRVRYDGERTRREMALFDAYEDESKGDNDDAGKGGKKKEESKKSKEETLNSQAVERLILGGDLIPPPGRLPPTPPVDVLGDDDEDVEGTPAETTEDSASEKSLSVPAEGDSGCDRGGVEEVEPRVGERVEDETVESLPASPRASKPSDESPSSGEAPPSLFAVSASASTPPAAAATNQSSQERRGSEDFILFHDSLLETGSMGKKNERKSVTDMLLEQSRSGGGNATAMGWSNYKGLGSALERCYAHINEGAKDVKQVISSTNSDTEKADEPEPATSVEGKKKQDIKAPPPAFATTTAAPTTKNDRTKAELVLSILTPYLDTWDENSARDVAENEIVSLFDESATFGEVGGGERLHQQSHPPTSASKKKKKPRDPSRLFYDQAGSMPGSETAADAMTNYIEFASVEKSRLTSLITTHNPSKRYANVSFADRYCWSHYMEFVNSSEDGEEIWERGVADGGRDIRSRLVSVPYCPMFKRFIPPYLDHGPSSKQLVADGDGEDDARRDAKVEEGESGGGGGSAMDVSNHALSMRNLVEAGNLKIVDITKKEVTEEAIEGSSSAAIPAGASSLDGSEEGLIEGDGSLGFPSPVEDKLPPTTSEVVDADDVDSASDTYPVDAKSDLGASASSIGHNGNDEGSEATKATTVTAQKDEQTVSTAVSTSATSAMEKLHPSLHQVHHSAMMSSSFSHPPSSASPILSLSGPSASGPTSAGGGHGMVELHYSPCLHVRAEGSRKCDVFLTGSHLILEYEQGEAGGLFEGEILAIHEEESRRKLMEEDKASALVPNFDESKENNKDPMQETDVITEHHSQAALRPKSIRWNLSELSHVYLRRYRLRDSALEMFFIPSGGTPAGGGGSGGPFLSSTSLFLDFGPGFEGNVQRDDIANAIMKRSPPQTVKQWPEKSGQFLHEQLSRLTMGWVENRITNFDYLLHLNVLAGRSYNDLCQYPVMPWVLSDYNSEDVPDLTDQSKFRDLSKPMGALNPTRLSEFIDRFETFTDPTIPPFMYGSHYSTSAGVVLHFLVRLHPFASLHRQLQGGHFDVADRLFSSVPRTWDMCTGSSAAEVKELTPEWYSSPNFLRNSNNFKLGTSQDGEKLGDVILPPWAKGSPEKFVEVMRNALESDICSRMLPDWIDLIFGRKQQGPEAIKANNVFFYLTYYGSVDVASIEDESLRTATELQIAHFGQCPMQLFWRPHVRKLPRFTLTRKMSLSQMLNAQELKSPTRLAVATEEEDDDPGDGNEEEENGAVTEQGISNDEKDIRDSTGQNDTNERNENSENDKLPPQMEPTAFLPFFSAPLSHWVHLAAPPPGPHSPLVAVRLAGVDRVLAVDGRGIFHSFRWAWKPEDLPPPGADGSDAVSSNNEHNGEGRKQDGDHSSKKDPTPIGIDRGCFVAQRELPNFRSVPKLPFAPPAHDTAPIGTSPSSSSIAVVAISKTLFASRSLLLVLSDGDGKGALAMQLVDPARGVVKGEAVVPAVHSGRVSAIATDPIGTAAGHGGVGGELAIIGSTDGTSTLWRFISSHYLPLRPRLRMNGHHGSRIHAVAVSSALNVVATVSKDRCCIFNIGNGTLIRTFSPPDESFDCWQGSQEKPTVRTLRTESVFADTPALCLSIQGFIVLVCRSTKIDSNSKVSPDSGPHQDILTLQLFSLEGIHIGSRVLESWRGIPHKITPTIDGNTVMVCHGRGVTIHRISAIRPLERIDEWHITETDVHDEKMPAAFDVDFGPALMRPVVCAAGCSSGALRLHALPGITRFSELNKKSSMTAAVGNALAKPAMKIKNAVGKGLGMGSRFMGFGKEVGKEAVSEVKERGVGGFLGGVFRKQNSSTK